MKLRKLKIYLRGVMRKLVGDSKTSYSQCGEDVIIEHLLNVIGLNKPYYLDLGAHHPSYLSNTYYFYKKGLEGVCVDADPSLMGAFKSKRPRDTTLNFGVGVENSDMDFYLMSSKTLNTFSKVEAERYVSYGSQKIEDIIKVEIKTVSSIIEDYCKKRPNLISLDVEGMDLLILNSFDFEKHRPEVFCIETLSYTEDKTERKLTEIIELMQNKDYFVYADTYINTIFVDKNAWMKR